MVTRRVFVAIDVLLAAALFSPNRVSAQACNTREPPCPDNPPFIGITPNSGTVTTATLFVAITLNDDRALDWSTLSISPPGFSGSSGPTSGTYTSRLQLQPGTPTTVTASIRDFRGQLSSASVTYTYTPPPPPPDKGLPIVNTAPHNGENLDVTRCVAGCFDNAMAHMTPAYVSLDIARSVSLVYNVRQAVSIQAVQVNVDANSVTPPQKMSIALRRPDGAWEPLFQSPGGAGTTEVFYQGAGGTSRLAAQFDGGFWGTTRLSRTVVIRSYWSDGTVKEDSAGVRILNLNERTNPIGWGWSFGGIQRVIWETDGLIVLDGNGSIAFFPNCSTGCTTQVSPNGDFTTLTRMDGTNGIYYQRRWPNGTTAAFDWHGRMMFVKDRLGNQTTFAWNGTSMQLASITDPIGQITTLTYDASGLLASIRDPGGRITTISHGPNNAVSAIQGPDGTYAFQGVYDGWVRLTQMTDRTGGTWTFAYDFANTLDYVLAPQVQTSQGLLRPTTAFRSDRTVALVDPASGTGTSATPA